VSSNLAVPTNNHGAFSDCWKLHFFYLVAGWLQYQLLALDECVIDFENQRVWVIGSKGRPPRSVPITINATATRVLRAMIRGRKAAFPGKRLSQEMVYRTPQCRHQQERRNREQNYHFHDLRSYFASELIRRNTNPLIVQNLFAHSDMSITTVYAQTDDKLLLEAVKRLDEIDDIEGP
jgi:integrase